LPLTELIGLLPAKEMEIGGSQELHSIEMMRHSEKKQPDPRKESVQNIQPFIAKTSGIVEIALRRSHYAGPSE